MKKKKLVIKKAAPPPPPLPVGKPRYSFNCRATVDGKYFIMPREVDARDYSHIQSDAILKPKYKGLFAVARWHAMQMVTSCHKIYPVAEVVVEVHDGHAVVYRVQSTTFNKDMAPPPKEE